MKISIYKLLITGILILINMACDSDEKSVSPQTPITPETSLNPDNILPEVDTMTTEYPTMTLPDSTLIPDFGVTTPDDVLVPDFNQRNYLQVGEDVYELETGELTYFGAGD